MTTHRPRGSTLASRSTAIALATALHLAAGAAVAQPAAMQPYAGVAVGRSSFDIDTAGATRADTRSTAYKLYGGLQFTPYLGAEVAAFDLGKATGAVGLAGLGTVTVEGKVRGLSLAGTATLPLTDAAAVYARAGIAHVQTKTTASTPFGGASQTDSSTQPVFAAGARWNINASLAARLEWERVRARFLDSEKVNTDLISVGLQARF